MGNHPSAHQPLERVTTRGNGLRLSKRERSPGKRMDRLRKSFRDSFRRRKDPHVPESSKSHQWQSDESAVRSATCAFHVKYLGCVEVYESRGMQVCEEALKVLRNSKRRPVRAVLHVSADGLRVVEDETKGLIVDQTIEKVSFCAPDRSHEKGFSYICRDGTTRRWMCHGFLALKESGERLSHAVGCAFAACLEKKQRRDNECGVTMTFDQRTSIFTRTGSFRQPSLTERLQDSRERAVDVPPARQVYNPFAIERPHATPSMLERQGSFRGFNQLNQASPFKRQLSLPARERTRSHSLEPTDLSRMPPTLPHQIPAKPPVSPIPEISPNGQDSVSAMCQQLSRGLSLLSSTDDFGPVIAQTTTSTVVKKLFNSSMTTSAMPGVTNSSSLDDLNLQNCQNLSDLASALTATLSNNNNNNVDENKPLGSDDVSWQEKSSSVLSTTNHRLTPILNQCCSLTPVLPRSSVNSTPALGNAASPAFSTASTSSLGSAIPANQMLNRSPVPLPQSTLAALGGDSSSNGLASASSSPVPMTSMAPLSTASLALVPLPTVPSFTAAPMSATQLSAVSTSTTSMVAPTMTSIGAGATDIASSTTAQPIPLPAVQAVPSTTNLPKPEQWLGSVTTQATAAPPLPSTSPRRAPALHARALSLGSAAMSSSTARTGPSDPFDAEWAEIAARNLRQTSTTNPFIVPNTTQAFQVQL